MISCVGAPACAMRRAIPTRPECPLYPAPGPVALAAARDRRFRQTEDRIRAVRILKTDRIEMRHRNRCQIDRARAGIGFRAPQAGVRYELRV